MKILYLITKSDWGGAQKYVFGLAVGLAKQNHNVLVAAGKGDGELFNALQQNNIPFAQLKHLERLPNPFRAIKAIKEIQSLVEKEKPDILHLNSTTAGVLGSIAGKIAKPTPKIVYTAHGWAFLEPGLLKKMTFFLLEAKTAWLKDKFIVLSNKEKKVSERWLGVDTKKISVIPNGLSEGIVFLEKSQARQALRLNPNDFIVGTIANLYKTKGLPYLLKALPEAVIIGDGPEKEKLQKQFPRANFLGKIPQAHQYLKAFDVFCLPSVKEGFPFVLLEAMAAGLPIITACVGAIPEILENKKEALLIKPKNPQQIKQAIIFFRQNPKETQKMAILAQKKSQLFSLGKTIAATQAIYNKLLA